MLNDAPVSFSFSVDDIKKARAFYVETLGLTVEGYDTDYAFQLKLTGGNVMVYAKKNHEPATFTLLNFMIDDLAATMKQMTDKGVTFETYDQPDIKSDENGVVDYGAMQIAFFNDPAGNNHAVVQMKQ